MPMDKAHFAKVTSSSQISGSINVIRSINPPLRELQKPLAIFAGISQLRSSVIHRADVAEELKWTDYLPLLEHELNSTPNSSTNFTPNELLPKHT